MEERMERRRSEKGKGGEGREKGEGEYKRRRDGGQKVEGWKRCPKRERDIKVRTSWLPTMLVVDLNELHNDERNVPG